MTAFLFVPLLAFTCIYAAALWTYASHAFLGVAEETAAGNDEVFTDDDPAVDWLWQGIYTAWLAGVWLVPALLLTSTLPMDLDERRRFHAAAAIVFAVFWLAFPLSVLSTMAAESRLALLYPGLFVRLARRGGDVLKFYLLTLPLMAACALLGPWLVTGSGYLPYLVAGPSLALALLLYARLLGRLACIARLTPVAPRKPRKKPKKAKPPRAEVVDPWELPEDVEAEEKARDGSFVQPRDLPPVESPYEGEMTGYDVRFDAGPAPEPSPAELPDEAERLAGPDAEVERNKVILGRRRRQDVSAIEPDPLELKRLTRAEEKPPERPWSGASVWLFIMQPKVAALWCMLALGTSFLGVLVQGLIVLWPRG